MREMPGLEEEVMARAPAAEAPRSMLMEATSLSAWMKQPSTLARFLDRYSGMSFWGVMG
jgi:hypothetical protein